MILYTAEQIQTQVARLASEIKAKLDKKYPLVVIGNLNGCLFFMADLCKHLDPHGIGVCQTATYKSCFYQEPAKRHSMIKMMPTFPLQGFHVILVDDVLDTGITMRLLIDRCLLHKPAKLELCILLDKPARRECHISPEYVGFWNVPDVHLYGYGMDNKEGYKRTLDHIEYEE